MSSLDLRPPARGRRASAPRACRSRAIRSASAPSCPAQAPAAEQEPLGLLVAFVGEVARGALLEVLRQVDGDLLEPGDVGVLRLLRRLDRLDPPLERLGDDVGG